MMPPLIQLPTYICLQAQVYLLDKLDIILAKSPEDEIKTEIIPLVFNTLDSNCIQAQVSIKYTCTGTQTVYQLR